MKDRSEKIIFAFLILFLTYAVSNKINLAAADLGRHLKNGEIFLKTFSIPKTNLYSYTYAEYSFLNHHWGSGVVFYLVKLFFGFGGLSLFFILLSLLTFSLLFNIAWKSSSFSIAVFLSLLAIPLIGIRTEIRPEIFSYFFSSLFFWLLFNYKHNKISIKYLYLLPVFELLWVNLHIYFPIGLLIFGLFFIESLIERKFIPSYIFIFCLCFIAVFINPFGLEGALYPFRIFNNYGYLLFENQTFQYIEKLFIYPQARYFKLMFFVLIASWIYKFFNIFKGKDKASVLNLVLFLFISYLGFTAVRNFSFFGYFALPIAAGNIRSLRSSQLFSDRFLFGMGAILLLLFIYTIFPDYWFKNKLKGFGLMEEVENTALFIKKNKIKGPIFNNYDIGGYLIYYLYPQETVFVDNRPEAYPKDFLNDTLIPIQSNNSLWKKAEEKYKFNAIVFYRYDATEWGQKFLIDRIKDDLWAPVYFDKYNIIFLKKDKVNKQIIELYEIPASKFIF